MTLVSFCILFVGNLYAQEVDSLISLEAKNYFNQAFKLIKNGSYKKNQIDFAEIYQKALPYLKGAKHSKDTYEAIRFTLASLNDKHSKFFYPKASLANQQIDKKFVFPIKAQIFKSDYAVLGLLSYSSINTTQNKKVADSIYQFIIKLKQSNIKNLIIDLRDMEGGANDPFLCGLAPLINKTELFTYVGNNNNKQKIIFEKGYIYRINKKAKFGDIYLSNYIRNEDYKSFTISILTGKNTASAGEIIAIAFKNLSNVTFIGEPTYGIPTGVASISLPDGASIGLASSVPLDRNGKSYTSPLIPDIALDMFGLSDQDIFQKIIKSKE